MKSPLKILLNLALVLPGVLSGCATTDAPAKLQTTKPWEETTIKLIVPGSSGPTRTTSKSENLNAKSVQYGSRFPLAAVFDPHTRTSYIVSGGQTFYISDSSGMIACFLFGGKLGCRKDYFKMSKSGGNLDLLISRFISEFDEQKLASQEDKNLFGVSLSVAAPFGFFTAQSLGGSQPGTPSIKAIDLTDGLLRLDLVSEGGKFAGSFWIDLKARKVIKSIIDGQEMDLHTDKTWPVPVKVK